MIILGGAFGVAASLSAVCNRYKIFIIFLTKNPLTRTSLRIRERSVHTNSESFNFRLERKKNQFNSNQIIQILQSIIIDNF